MDIVEVYSDRITATGTDQDEILDAVESWINSDSEFFTVQKFEDGGNTVTLYITPTTEGEDWGFYFSSESASAGVIAGMLDPDPGTPQQDPAAAASVAASPYSGDMLSDFFDIDTVELIISETSDTITLINWNAAGDGFPSGFHVGRVYTTGRLNGDELGIDGLGILGGYPEVTRFSSGGWIANTSGDQSLCRVGPTHWESCRAHGENAPDSHKLGGNDIVGLAGVVTDDDEHLIGILKHLSFWDNSRDVGKRVSDDSTNESWIHISNGGSDQGLLRVEYGKDLSL